jgi:hypothetical protein
MLGAQKNASHIAGHYLILGGPAYCGNTWTPKRPTLEHDSMNTWTPFQAHLDSVP